ncbi:MAG: T9SS type A sorting domain-containing protein [Bacteroidota bacterium]
MISVQVWDSNQDTLSAFVQLVLLGECVWPGDANGDALANNHDVLALGQSFGSTGYVRPNAHTNWIGQAAHSWTQQFGNGINYAHADTDGDGMVDDVDFPAIYANYFQPQLSPGNSLISPNGALMLVDLLPQNYSPGDTIRMPIFLGNLTQTVANVYGIAFSIEYDNALVDSGSVWIDYTGSWLGDEGNDLQAIDKDFFNFGQIDIGMTRIDQLERTGGGRIADIIITVDDIAGKRSGIETIQLSLKNISLLRQDGSAIDINPQTRELSIATSNETLVPDVDVKLYPNPSPDVIRIEWRRDMNNSIKNISILNQNGQKVASGSLKAQENHMFFSTKHLADGLYVVMIQTETGVLSRKFVKE